MFYKKTVFIVGAGGSKEVGLPVGDELKTHISEKLNFYFADGFNLSSGDAHVYHAVSRHMHANSERDGNPYWLAGRSIAHAMPQAPSVEHFLHTHSDDDKIVMMGKLGIAACILDAERRSSIYIDSRVNSQSVDFARSANAWHNIFCKMLSEGVQRHNIESIFENVAFITFNYDRCIEHYLAAWLESYMRIPAADAQNLVNNLTIIHPYGQIGKLPWQKSGMISVTFGAELDEYHLLDVSENIRTFTERVDGDAVIKKTQRVIAEAETLVYLGFSFGAMDMDLMAVNDGIEKTAYMTVFGISEPNILSISTDIDNRLTASGKRNVFIAAIENCTSADLLNDYYRALTS